jgi:hypothetical protein
VYGILAKYSLIGINGMIDYEDGGIIIIWKIGKYLKRRLVENKRKFE